MLIAYCYGCAYGIAMAMPGIGCGPITIAYGREFGNHNAAIAYAMAMAIWLCHHDMGTITGQLGPLQTRPPQAVGELGPLPSHLGPPNNSDADTFISS